MTRPLNARLLSGSFCGLQLAAALLAACNSHTPPPPSPQARQQEAVEAERKAASVEAEMNKDAGSENIDKKPDGTPPK